MNKKIQLIWILFLQHIVRTQNPTAQLGLHHFRPHKRKTCVHQRFRRQISCLLSPHLHRPPRFWKLHLCRFARARSQLSKRRLPKPRESSRQCPATLGMNLAAVLSGPMSSFFLYAGQLSKHMKSAFGVHRSTSSGSPCFTTSTSPSRMSLTTVLCTVWPHVKWHLAPTYFVDTI
jgi:hypothetical protein